MNSKIFLLIGLMAVACGERDEADKRTPDDGFSLAVPQDKWDASRFCPTQKPELPEDPTPYFRHDKKLVQTKLETDGLSGWIHGAVPMYQQYVFTYRKEDPNDFMAFFKAEQFSLVPMTPEVAQAFATLKRHDQVRLKGNIFENGSPLTHIKVTGIEVVKKYDKPTDNQYKFDLGLLKGRKTFDVFGQVHATAHEKKLGHAVIVEHNDMMFPVAVAPQHAAVAATLYKGDIVNVKVLVVEHPHGPPHFMTNPEAEQGIQVVDPLLHCHNVPRMIEGFLVKFEQSPAISTDVYAVRVVDGNGIGRNFTFFPGVSMMDPAFMTIFEEVSAKAKAAWDSEATDPQVVRNYRSKVKIKVSAKGVMNVVSTEQANAQIYITSADDVTFTTAE